MPFYEVLKLLMTEPGKHHFRRKSWNNDSDYNNNKFICSFGTTTKSVSIVIAQENNNTGFTFRPYIDDITANDWIEV